MIEKKLTVFVPLPLLGSPSMLAIMIRVFSILSFFFILFVAIPATAQIKWLTWEEAQAKNQHEPKKFMVDVFIQLCGWCKKMDVTTFEDPNISAYVNLNYYPIKFDAETKTDINFKNKVYKYVRQGSTGYNLLAEEIMFGKLSYPTIVFLDEKLNVIQPLPGYKDPGSLDKILRYFAEDYYKTMPWKKYDEMYQHQHPVTPNTVLPEKKD